MKLSNDEKQLIILGIKILREVQKNQDPVGYTDDLKGLYKLQIRFEDNLKISRASQERNKKLEISRRTLE